ATPGMYLNDKGEVIKGLSTKGHLAVGVPGTVAGLEAVRLKFGTRDRADLIAPAIELADKGFALDQGDVQMLDTAVSDFKQDPPSAKIFLKQGEPYKAGDILVQKDLAQSLRLIAKDGPDAVYKGPIGEAIAASSQAGQGLLTKADFLEYNVRELKP